MYVFSHHFQLIVGFKYGWFFYMIISLKHSFKWFGAVLQNMAIVKEEQATSGFRNNTSNCTLFNVEIIAESVVIS